MHTQNNIIIHKDKEDKNSIEVKSLLKGASVLVVALAFNDFAKSITEWLFPINMEENNRRNRMFAFLVYFVLVTIVVLVMIFSFNFAYTKINGESKKYEKEAKDINNLLNELSRGDKGILTNYNVFQK